MPETILELHEAKMYFSLRRGFLGERAQVKAVDGVSLALRRGETFGLVGESGCGKTTLGKCILRLHQITEGRILFEGKEISALAAKEFLPYRRRISMIFQDPGSCLNPRLKVRQLVAEPLRFHKLQLSGKEIDRAVDRVLEDVGLSRTYRNRYPHEFSGGQQQRIGIARALIMQPRFVVCDEPVSALDVSVQAQIINLLNGLQEQYSLTFLFISHDLSVVKFISRRVGIMYLGKIVEVGESRQLFAGPAHPYTVSLLSAAPTADPHVRKKRIILTGEVPSPVSIPSGCRFHPRCRYATEVCRIEPALEAVEAGHLVACHNFREVRRESGG
jgi:oligopeptide transport system ATP-binding protein